MRAWGDDINWRRYDDLWRVGSGLSWGSGSVTTPPRPVAAPPRDVVAQLIAPALHVQHWSLDGAVGSALSRAVHLQSGQGGLGHAEGEIALRPGTVVWLPAGAARWLRMLPGSTGVTVAVSDALLAQAAGGHPEAAALRDVAERPCVLSAPEPAPRDELVRSLHALEAESRRGAAVSRPYLAAHLTLVLVQLWRIGAGEAQAGGAARAPVQRLLRFRHLVEAQFRAHWPIHRYAQELGISADRLHDLCTRTLQRTPLELLHQRVAREACSLLAGTDRSVERVAADLGFGSTSHFSRFFKRRLGQHPSAWRRQSRAGAGAGVPSGLPAGYADWP